MMGRSAARSAGHIVQLALALAGRRAVHVAIVLATSPACGCTGTVDTVPADYGGPEPPAVCAEGLYGLENCAYGNCGSLACWTGSLCVARRTCVPPGYWIDSTEVTRSQYEAWVATDPSLAAQPPTCAWNDSAAWDAWCMTRPTICVEGSCGDHPQECVNWCQAYAYCQAVGKRLCGRIGGGPVSADGLPEASESQWYNACSSGGLNRFPYGQTYSATACNGSDLGLGRTTPVGAMSECHSSVPGFEDVFDLSGNAWEWEDSCERVDGGPADYCRVGGGAADWGYDFMDCVSVYMHSRSSVAGFRCCGP